MKVVFFDEEKFNLDGPDGSTYCWHGLQHKPRYFSTRQQRGASLMIWAAISYYCVSDIHVLSANQDSQK